MFNVNKYDYIYCKSISLLYIFDIIPNTYIHFDFTHFLQNYYIFLFIFIILLLTVFCYIYDILHQLISNNKPHGHQNITHF